MRVVIAPNAFKNALTAAEAALAVRRGLEGSRLGGTYECFPVGDGGDGTGDLIIERLGGRKVEAVVRDPLGRGVGSYWGLIGAGGSGSAVSGSVGSGSVGS